VGDIQDLDLDPSPRGAPQATGASIHAAEAAASSTAEQPFQDVDISSSDGARGAVKAPAPRSDSKTAKKASGRSLAGTAPSSELLPAGTRSPARTKAARADGPVVASVGDIQDLDLDPSPRGAPQATGASVHAAEAAASSTAEQPFQDVDISSSDGAWGAVKAPAPRFESKAKESASGLSLVGGAAPSQDLLVTVSNPQKQGEGMSAFFTYEVHTKTSLKQFKSGQCTVIRRFSTFDWLHSQLVSKYPGVIIPPLPEKHSAQVSTMRVSGVGCSAEWLEQRRVELGRFLQRVAAHPQLHYSRDLQIFLEASEEELEAAQAKPSSYIGEVFGDVKQGLRAMLSTESYTRPLKIFSNDSAPPFTAETDLTCQQMANYVATLERQMADVHKHSKRMVDRHQALAKSVSGFGTSVTQLAKCETEINESLANALSAMGRSVSSMSNVYDKQASTESQVFVEPMSDYLRMLAQCKQAIGAREASLRVFNSAAAQLAAKRDRRERAEKVAASGSREERSASVLEEEQALEAHECAKLEYERVAATLDAEMARFQREKLIDLKRIVVGFVTTQLEYSQKIQAEWQSLLPLVGNIEGGSPSRSSEELLLAGPGGRTS